MQQEINHEQQKIKRKFKVENPPSRNIIISILISLFKACANLEVGNQIEHYASDKIIQVGK